MISNLLSQSLPLSSDSSISDLLTVTIIGTPIIVTSGPYYPNDYFNSFNSSILIPLFYIHS